MKVSLMLVFQVFSFYSDQRPFKIRKCYLTFIQPFDAEVSENFLHGLYYTCSTKELLVVCDDAA